jgi:4-hydroxy-3-polyprenylbenzoate decarboxylase
MPFKDNRQYIEALEKNGDLIRIKQEVDWDREVGAIVRRTNEKSGPAFLAEKIKDYPGHRIFGGPVASFRRVATALGLPPETHPAEIMDTYYERASNPIKPVLVKDAPCQEVVITGKDVNLLDFPAPMVHEGDGGRYLSTWHFVITKDPDSGWVNWGMYRQMVHNERHLGGLILPGSDCGKVFYEKYVKHNKPMPFAVAISPDPLSAIASVASVGAFVDEVDIAGGIMGEPIELVKCKTVDLEVPAHAEIILEGEILPDVTVEEGPFGEYTGFRSSPRMPRALYRVNCITHRKDPILCMSNMGIPIDDCAITVSIAWRSMVQKILLDIGIPIKGVYVPPEGIGHLVVVSTETPYNNIATQIGMAIFSSRMGNLWMHQVIVVDADVDAYDMKQVIHSVATKCHPTRGIRVIDNAPSNPLAPYLSLYERTWSKGGKVIFDCTWPLDWHREIEVPFKSGFNTIYSEEIQKKVLDNWKKYGFKD